MEVRGNSYILHRITLPSSFLHLPSNYSSFFLLPSYIELLFHLPSNILTTFIRHPGNWAFPAHFYTKVVLLRQICKSVKISYPLRVNKCWFQEGWLRWLKGLLRGNEKKSRKIRVRPVLRKSERSWKDLRLTRKQKHIILNRI